MKVLNKRGICLGNHHSLLTVVYYNKRLQKDTFMMPGHIMETKQQGRKQ